MFSSACTGQGAAPVVTFDSVPPARSQVDDPDTNSQSVTYQINIHHTGYASGPLALPLKKIWRIDFGPEQFVGHSIIANGIVVVTAGHRLLALDEKTGKKLWSKVAPRMSYWTGLA
jgi:outer membrane protein assembly factor BamB